MVRTVVRLGVIAALLTACSAEQQPMPTDFEVSLPLYAKGGNADFNIGTHLTGDEEPLPTTPPTPAESPAQGQAIFRVNATGTSVDFRLIASNIENVFMAHIHCGPPGINGPIRMWLFPVVGPSGTALTFATGRHDGVLATGTFNPTGITCPASAVGSVMPLLTAMRTGLAYVNVHTNDFVGAINTGPGDFPVGEIRGQLDQPNSQ